MSSPKNIHSDIIQTHILTKLDGETLVAVGCSSSEFNSLCSDDKLWYDICTAKWPSVADHRVRDAVTEFPGTSGYRSLFSDSFPGPCLRRRCRRPARDVPQPDHLISAVDLHYGDRLIFSKVESTNTARTGWFVSSPFGIDLLEPKEVAPAPVKFELDEIALKENMSLSWILIDPTGKRSVNLSSIRPVSVTRNWLTQDVRVLYSTVVDGSGPDSEPVEFSIEVTCGMGGSGELHVGRVSLRVQDLDGKSLSGEDSLVILEDVLEDKRREKRRSGREGERYERFMGMKRERKEMEERRERRLDMMCIGIATGITSLISFWIFNMFS